MTTATDTGVQLLLEAIFETVAQRGDTINHAFQDARLNADTVRIWKRGGYGPTLYSYLAAAEVLGLEIVVRDPFTGRTWEICD